MRESEFAQYDAGRFPMYGPDCGARHPLGRVCSDMLRILE
jgi:hypothetical protein